MDGKRSIFPYNRENAVHYAHRWAYGRNPMYYDFENIGGDCTNFASQCIYAGSGVMNYTPVYGWYYVSAYNRAPSWTGVNYLYDFLANNYGSGPFAELADIKDVKPGDIIQLSFGGDGIYNHSPVVVYAGNPPTIDNILVAAHTDNVDNYPLTGYTWADMRVMHIIGVGGN